MNKVSVTAFATAAIHKARAFELRNQFTYFLRHALRSILSHNAGDDRRTTIAAQAATRCCASVSINLLSLIGACFAALWGALRQPSAAFALLRLVRVGLAPNPVAF